MRHITTRKLNRLKGYDYSRGGAYFVTICAQNREESFGEIKNGRAFLNICGKIVSDQWLWLAERYNYVRLDEYIIMPNHIHGIVIINNDHYPRIDNVCRDRSRPVPTRGFTREPQPIPTHDFKHDFKNEPRPVPTRGFTREPQPIPTHDFKHDFKNEPRPVPTH